MRFYGVFLPSTMLILFRLESSDYAASIKFKFLNVYFRLVSNGTPLAVYVTLLILSFNNPILQQAAVINASMPMFSIYPLISQKYGYQDLCAAAMVATTVISFFTITGLLWIIHLGI